MNHATTCKLCKRPITLEIDDAYEEDVLNLIPLAACNACADARVDRRRLESKLAWLCSKIGFLKREERDAFRGVLVKFTQDYAKVIARYHRMDGMAWDEAVVDSILEMPQKWGEFVGRLWKIFRQSQAQASLPYKDE